MGWKDVVTKLPRHRLENLRVSLLATLFRWSDSRGYPPSVDVVLIMDLPLATYPDIHQAFLEHRVIDLVSDLSGKIKQWKKVTLWGLNLVEMQL